MTNTDVSLFGFEGINPSYIVAQWLSWLERRPVTAKVVGSSPIWVVAILLLRTIIIML